MVSTAPRVRTVKSQMRMSASGYSALKSSCALNCRYTALGMMSHTTSPSRSRNVSSRCRRSGRPAILIMGFGAE